MGGHRIRQPGSKLPIPLNTSQWAHLIPALPQKYPDRLLEMSASARVHPAAPCTKAKGFTVYYPLALDTLVLPPAGKSAAPATCLPLAVAAAAASACAAAASRAAAASAWPHEEQSVEPAGI